MRRPAGLLLASLLLAGCSGDSVPRALRGDPGGAPVPLPNQYAGGDADDPGLSGNRARPETPPPSEAEMRAALAARGREADALWQAAEATADHEEAADLYGDIAEDYPEVPRAAEARYRQGERLYRAGEWADAVAALREYMSVAPVNPHMRDVEEMVYTSGIRYIEEGTGLLAIFRTDDAGLEALRYVPVTFPAGELADDALLRLARYYQEDDELDTAALFYKELLLRYPDSEWSFQARLGLARTYMVRDQGNPYHAGFVDRDPREKVPDDERAEAHAGPVKSSLELAIEQYDIFLERIARDPGRRAEYASQVAEAEAARQGAIERLAAKEDGIATWYAARGDAAAADVYRRSAARRRGAPVGSPVPTVAPPPVVPAAPAPSPPAPTTLAPRPPAPLPPAPRPPASGRQGVPPPPPPPTLPPTPAGPGSGPTTRTVPLATRPAVPAPPPPPAWPR